MGLKPGVAARSYSASTERATQREAESEFRARQCNCLKAKMERRGRKWGWVGVGLRAKAVPGPHLVFSSTRVGGRGGAFDGGLGHRRLHRVGASIQETSEIISAIFPKHGDIIRRQLCTTSWKVLTGT